MTHKKLALEFELVETAEAQKAAGHNELAVIEDAIVDRHIAELEAQNLEDFTAFLEGWEE
jgi:hypothetical protein